MRPACLAMVLSYHGHEFDLNTLRRQFPISIRGVTLKELMEISGRFGPCPRGAPDQPTHLAKLRLPAVTALDLNHFVCSSP